MKKRKIALMFLSGACVLALSAGIAGCADVDLTSGGAAGESTTLVTNKAPDELTPENAIYAFLQKQSELTSYVITTEGTAVASLAGYRQDIHNTTYKNGDDYLNQASSESVLVNMKHQAFSKNGKVVYRDSFDGEMKVADKDDYKKVYGFTADDVTLGGYIINPKTLRYATVDDSSTDSTITYYMRLAGDQSVASGSAVESATSGVRLQSRAYGSLDAVPDFSDVDVYLTIKKDWTPVSYTTTCSYDCKKVISMSVEQTLTCTYSKVNAAVTIPDLEAFNKKIGTEPSEIKPDNSTEDPLISLASAFGNSMNADGEIAMPVSFGFNALGVTEPLTADLNLRLDQAMLEAGEILSAFKLRFDVDLSGIPLVSRIADTLTVRYPGDGLLLIMLNNRAGGSDSYRAVYTVDLSSALPIPDGATFDLGEIFGMIESYITIGKTDSGYTIALSDSALTALNDAFGGLIDNLGTSIGDADGALADLLNVEFTGISVKLNGTDTITGISANLDGTSKIAEILPALEPVFSLADALANSVNESGEIVMPITFGFDVLGVTDPLSGTLALHLDEAMLTGGNIANAINLRFDLDLSDIPLISNIVNNVTVRYPGDGMLLIQLSNRDGGSDSIVATYTLDLASAAPMSEGSGFDLQGILDMVAALSVEKKTDGYSISLNEDALATVNEAIGGLVESLGSSIGDAGTLVGELLDMTLTEVSVNFTGTDTITGISANLDGTSKIAEILPSLEPVISLVAALGNSMNASGEISMPISLGFDAFGATKPLEGVLGVQFDKAVLSGGDIASAIKARFDVDLSDLPLISGIADTLTVRYPGDGLLLIMLNNRAGGSDSYIATYTLDLASAAPMSVDEGSGLDLQSILGILEMISLEKTDSGYTLSLGEEVLTMMNDAFDGLLADLEASLSDTRGIIRSLFDATFTNLSVTFDGTDAITGITAVLEGTPAENTTQGVKCDLTIDTALLNGLIKEPITGVMQLRLSPTELWAGNFYNIVQASLSVDLATAGDLLAALGILHISQIPELVTSMKALDLYYNDGVISIIFWDGARSAENRKPIEYIEVDLRDVLAGGVAAQADVDGDPNANGEGDTPRTGLPELSFTLKTEEKGIWILLGDETVTALDAAYNTAIDSLIESAAASAGIFGSTARSTLTSFLKATITDVEFYLGLNEADHISFDLAVKGTYKDTEGSRLLGVNFAYDRDLTEDERTTLAAMEELKAVQATYAKVHPLELTLQSYIDYIDLTADGMATYAKNVEDLKTEINQLADNEKSLLDPSDLDYLSDLEYSDKKTYIKLILMQQLYRTRVDAFLAALPEDDNYANFNAAQWTALNSLYDTEGEIKWGGFAGIGAKTITIPAVKDCKAMQDAIGEARVNAYVSARNSIPANFLAEVNAANEALASKTTEEDLKAAIAQCQEIIAKYGIVPEEDRAAVNEAYYAYILEVATKNLNAIKAKYETAQATIGEISETTIEQLITALQTLNEAAMWHTGVDGLTPSTPAATWGSGWVETLLGQLPAEGEQHTALSTLSAEVASLRTAVADAIATKFKTTIVSELNQLKPALEACKKRGFLSTTYDFSSLGDNEAKKGWLTKTSALRYLFNNAALSSNVMDDVFSDDANGLRTFVTGDIKTFETRLAADIG